MPAQCQLWYPATQCGGAESSANGLCCIGPRREADLTCGPFCSTTPPSDSARAVATAPVCPSLSWRVCILRLCRIHQHVSGRSMPHWLTGIPACTLGREGTGSLATSAGAVRLQTGLERDATAGVRVRRSTVPPFKGGGTVGPGRTLPCTCGGLVPSLVSPQVLLAQRGPTGPIGAILAAGPRDCRWSHASPPNPALSAPSAGTCGPRSARPTR